MSKTRPVLKPEYLNNSDFLAQFEQAKKDVERLRKAFPELFDKNGRWWPNCGSPSVKDRK